ncbi:hypothetical protein FLP10_07845 [Agromyces intestinalis]|uniref:Uncharacterized protein n=1 Tax=Agromyces intestinalis TaxID=2592652 RepID=A0A5C1YGX2_9MICO|nr:hypothetical protein [Agromyces intestinalis]QEO14339.1 hypothetical protein FLP10_07845 [Agromyces intestinalis]
MTEDVSPARRALPVIAIGLAAAGLIAVLIGAGPTVERAIAQLPGVPSNRVGLLLVAASALVLVLLALRRLRLHARDRTRRRALESSLGATVTTSLRTPMLTAALDELGGEHGRVGPHFSIVADATGIAFWRGGRRPRRVGAFAWREIRSIRCDRIAAGARSVPVAVLRVRRGGSSLEVPLLLASERAFGFALPDEAFFATVRGWKAEHRAALAAEGLELPPLTSPIPIITPEQLAAAAAGGMRR